MTSDSLVFASNPKTSSGHQYADIVGVQYEYPLRYRNQIQTGRRFVYYRSGEGSAEPYYWGTGIVGEIKPSGEPGRLICAVLDYQEFEQRVPFKDAGGDYLEPGGATRGYYQPGVRTVPDDVFDAIVELGSVTVPAATPEGTSPPSGAARKKAYASSEHAEQVERISMQLVGKALIARHSGMDVRPMPHSNPGYDYEVGPAGDVARYVEVKGTVARYVDFFMSEGERQFSIKHSERYTLAVVHTLDLAAETGTIAWFDGGIDERFTLDPTQWRARRAET